MEAQPILEPAEAVFLLSKLTQKDLVEQFAELLAADPMLDVDQVVAYGLRPRLQAKIIDQLVAAGVTIDPDKLYHSVSQEAKLSNLARFLRAGATIDLQEVARSLTLEQLCTHLSSILEAAVPIDLDTVIEQFEANNLEWALLRSYPQLTAAGYKLDLQAIADRESDDLILRNLDVMREAGVSLDNERLAEKARHLYGSSDHSTALFANEISQLGGTVDLKGIIGRLAADGSEFKYLESYTEGLLKAGASPELLLRTLDAEGIARNLQALIAAGGSPDVDAIVQRLTPSEAVRHYIALRRAGASVPELQKKAGMPEGDRQQPKIGDQAEAPLHVRQKQNVGEDSSRAHQNQAVIRQWLQEHGYAVGPRGRIPLWLRAHYYREINRRAATENEA